MDKNIDVRSYNRDVWNNAVATGNQWTVPVSPEAIEAARRGDWQIVLTPTKPIPREWFGVLEGARTLCLASGGGQQGPILAAAGAIVTVYDNSPAQLAQDRFVAERDGLTINTIEGDMRDLSAFADESFDLIVHPCSNCFVPDILPVWKEAWRVLRKGGALLAGFTNPILYIFEEELAEYGVFRVVNTLPYSDFTHLSPEQLQQRADKREAIEFSHTLEEQIGGQLEAGFVLANFFEDKWEDRPISHFAPTFIATRAIKL